MPTRAEQLAIRIEEGAAALKAFAEGLTDLQWRMIVPRDGRSFGVIIHHVASIYPVEMDVVRMALKGEPIRDVTWAVVADINAAHAKANPNPTKAETLALLERNAKEAAAGVRVLTGEELSRAVPFSLSYGATVTVQFIIEDHPLRHPWHHMARMRETMEATSEQPRQRLA
jgi:hypothetical protein